MFKVKWLWFGVAVLLFNALLIDASFWLLNQPEWFGIFLGLSGLLCAVSVDVDIYRKVIRPILQKKKDDK